MNNNQNKLGALALTLGAFLNVIRMIPIYAEVGFDGYPPVNLSGTIDIAQRNGYYLSHILVFFATPLFLVGFFALCQRLGDIALNRGLLMALVVFSIGQILYVVGVVIHGLVLPAMAAEYVASSAAEQAAMAPLFELNHRLATSYGGLGLAQLLVSTGIIGFFLRKESQWLGIGGIAIGILALAGYMTGFLDVMLFGSFVPTAGLATAMFAFYLIAGVRMFKDAPPR